MVTQNVTGIRGIIRSKRNKFQRQCIEFVLKYPTMDKMSKALILKHMKHRRACTAHTITSLN